MRLLVVEDDAPIAEALRDLLELEGHSVAVAYNGREALDHIRAAAEPPDAVLLDLMMPVLDGYGFLAARAQDASLAAVPVLVVSADRQAERELGHQVHAVLKKPIQIDDLLEHLAALKPA